MDLSGTSALVTGAAKRIGKTITLHLASLGCDVAVHYRKSLEEAKETAELVERQGSSAFLVCGDLSIREEAVRVAEQVLRWRPQLGILVNSASTFPRVDLSEIALPDWEEALGTNLLGPFWLAQRIGPEMVRHGCGKIINIADISWKSPWTTRLPYCISKAGLVSLTVGLAKAFAPQVQVNAIGPGPILFPEEYTQEQRERVIAKTLLKRQGTPEDIALAVEFLCRSDYVTGHFLPVDGGQSLPGA